MKLLTERDLDTLNELRAASDSYIEVYEGHKTPNGDDSARARGWVMPMDCGGSNGSHHSYTLHKLAKRGLCDRRKYGGQREKGSCRYRINDAGRALLESQKAERRPKQEGETPQESASE